MAAGYAVDLRNSRGNATTTFVGSGAKMEIYSGSQPATGGTETTLLATFTMGTPFGGANSAGVFTGTLPADVNASATGTATWARIYKADGTTFCMDLSVGTSGTQVIMNSVSLTSGVACSITAITITEGNA